MNITIMNAERWLTDSMTSVLNKALRLLLVAVLLASFVLVLPQAHAQTTSLTVQYPDHVTVASDVEVAATVSYSGKGAYLGVALVDASTSDFVPVPGEVSSSPDPCFYSNQTGCAIRTKGTSGAEIVHFRFAAPPEPKDWRLVVAAELADSNANLISSSASFFQFTIKVTGPPDTVLLHVSLPAPVHAIIDGVDKGSGSLELFLKIGSHTISIPESIQIDDTSRLRFVSWSDGSNLHDRPLYLSSDETLEANYATQYRLTIVSPLNVTGAGWYDQGSSASFSASSSQPMNSSLGLVGGKWAFEGWYEDGKFVSSSTSGSITMDKPHALQVRWRTDYTLPLASLVAIVAVGIGLGYLAIRRKSALQEATTGQVTRLGLEQQQTWPEAVQTDEKAGAKLFCMNCGAKLAVDSKFCSQCGVPTP